LKIIGPFLLQRHHCVSVRDGHRLDVRLVSVCYNMPLCSVRTGSKRKSNPITGLDRPRGFQEVKGPRFRDNGTGWW